MSNKLVKAAKTRAVEQATSRGGIVARPVAALTGELGLSVALWVAESPESLPWMTPALSLSTAGMVALVWHTGRDRTPVGRVLSVGTTVLTGAHLITSTIVGPFTSPLVGIWLWLGGTTAAAWMYRLHVARGKDTVEDGKAQVSLWDRAATKTGGALTGSAFTPKEVTADRMTGPLALEAGETVRDAQASKDRLASVLGLPPGGVRITPDPSDASKGELTLVRTDVLREDVPYAGPSALGGTPADPYRVGKYEHGRAAVLPLHIPGFGEIHLLIMGMTGSGKTKGAHQLFAEEFTRTDTYTIYVDTVKGAQSLGPIGRGIRWAMRTEAEALALMKVLKSRVIPGRAQYLGKRKLSAWAPGCGLVRLRIHVEEGSGLFLGNKDFTRVLEQARSVGVQVTISGQRFSYASLDVSARAQFGAVLCFGLAEAEDARFAMPDAVRDAGADPSLWGNEHPGMSYVVAPKIDKADHTVPLRAELPTEEELEMLAEYARINGDDLDEFTANLFGELYTSRIPVADMLADDAPPIVIPDEDDDEFFDDGEAPAWAPSEVDPAPEVQPDIDDPMVKPTGSTLRFGERAAKATPEAAAAMFETRLVALQTEGRDEVRAADLVEVARAAGRSAAWVYKLLKQRVDSGHLVRTDSGFRFARALTTA